MARISADKRRQDFIEAAVRIIAVHGVSGATTRRIAEEADAPLATLHYCFHTKEQLFFAVFQHLSEEISTSDADASEPVGLAPAARAWIANTADWTIAHDDYARAEYELYFWALRQDGDDAGLAAEVYGLFYSRLEKELRGALRPGDDESLVDPLSRLLVGIVDGMIMQWHGHHDRARFDADLEVVGQMLETLIASRAAR
ncbi:hypothetical protein GCM10027062_14880 [Nocardioides hungaricus]